MKTRALAWVAIAASTIVLLCTGAIGAIIGTGAASSCLPRPTNNSVTNPAGSSPPTQPPSRPPADPWSSDQVTNAATIVTVGADLRIPRRGWVVALATAMQESSLQNLPGGDRDSVGLFQQRPSQGWGTPTQLADPVYAATRFYHALLKVDGWQNMPVTEAAQAVQRSAYPEAYAQWEDDANALLEEEALGIPADCINGVSAAGWTQPVNAPLVSGFRTSERPNHDGVDLAAPAETPIRAAATGQVITAACDTDPSGQLCNRRGSPSTPGCGWYVKLRHANNFVTMYCHMIRAPIVRVGQIVTVGQQLGQVGSSGHSSGDHLHFEVHAPDRGPIDPVPHMRIQGAPLGQQGRRR